MVIISVKPKFEYHIHYITDPINIKNRPYDFHLTINRI